VILRCDKWSSSRGTITPSRGLCDPCSGLSGPMCRNVFVVRETRDMSCAARDGKDDITSAYPGVMRNLRSDRKFA
jgi:hypothetical protein